MTIIDQGMDVPMFATEKLPHVLTMAERFRIMPFSVLDASAGLWQDRKNMWKLLGIQAEVGRDARAYGSDEDHSFLGEKISEISGGVSIFDPVVCEVAYRWYAVHGGMVLDPFAGGSVRGIVASVLGCHYTGIDLSQRQIDANYDNLDNLTGISYLDGGISWTQGDSSEMVPRLCKPESVDAVFSCPPYFDLEVYSDGERDISTMRWEAFLEVYRSIIWSCVAAMKPNRFATFVVTEIRDKKTGMYRNFVGETVRAFEDAGCHFYNEHILMTPLGSVRMMVSRQFEASRKIGRRHQNILTFVKGDPKKATQTIIDSWPPPIPAAGSGE